MKVWLPVALAAVVATAACVATNGGMSCGNGVDGGSSCTVGDASYPINCAFDPGFTPTCPDMPNSIGVTFSGETLGVYGLPYVPNLPGDPVFVDGWSVEFYEYIAVVGNIRLNLNAVDDATWTDMGRQVAIKPGPFVLDAHRAHGFLGKDGVEPASGLFLWTQLDDGQSFDQSQVYAWSFDIVRATYPATNVNLAPTELPDYDLMVQSHWSKLIRGKATHTLGLNSTSATPGTYANQADANAPNAQRNFAALPGTVYFAFGWDDHTSVLNCVNPDNGDGAEDNLANRGVQTNDNGMTVAQITLHTDHVFWDTLEHEGEPLRFDPIAAWAPANSTQDKPFWINDLTSQPLATVFQDGTPLPDRGPFMTGNNQPFQTDMPNGGTQVILNRSGVTSGPPGSYPDFMAFSAQSQPHLNAQGLCYIQGQHASDPTYSPSVQPVP